MVSEPQKRPKRPYTETGLKIDATSAKYHREYYRLQRRRNGVEVVPWRKKKIGEACVA